MIDFFAGDYRFLSNFFPCKVYFEDEHDARWYPSTEHAYQAAKSTNVGVRRMISTTEKAGVAKRLGRTITLRSDWEQVKLDVMYKVCKDKFTRYRSLATKLLSTGDEELIEGNDWGDKFWGRVGNTGENHLGKILMRIREELRRDNSVRAASRP